MIPKPIGGVMVALYKPPYRSPMSLRRHKKMLTPAYHRAGSLAVTNLKDYTREKFGRWVITTTPGGFRIGCGFEQFEQASEAVNILSSSGWDLEAASREKDEEFVQFARTLFSAVEKLWECGFEDGMEAEK